MSPYRQPAIILSGNTNAVGMVRALAEHGVPVVVFHYQPFDVAQRSRYVVESMAAPHPEKDPEGFLSLLQQAGMRWQGGIIFPVADETVVFAARYRNILEQTFKVACPSWDRVRQYIEKRQTYELAAACGVAMPRTLIPKDEGDLMDFASKVAFPCLVKPSEGHRYFEHFKRKMTSVANLEELTKAYSEASAAGFEVMVQEYIPGGDEAVVNYNAYFMDGKPMVEFTARHIRNAPPSFGSPRVVRSEQIPEVIDPGRRLLQSLSFNGYACTEFKRDARDGIYKLMEINGRHNLSTLLAVRCGINFPLMHYRHLLFGDIPQKCQFEEGRYWIDLVRDIEYSVAYHKQEKYSIKEYLRPYCHHPIFAIFSIRDPLPFLIRISYVVKNIFQKLPYLSSKMRRRVLKGIKI